MAAGRGRPAKPVEQKRKLGNPGKRALPTAGALALVPAVAKPEALTKSPDEAFDQVLQAGVHWLASTDLPKVTMLRLMLEERGDLYGAVLAGHGDRKALRDLDKVIMVAMSDLGFDPTARSRLGLAEVKAQSKLEELRAKRAIRAEVVDADDED